jgi:hypothetical protein
VTGKAPDERATKRYALLNNKDIRSQVVAEAATRYGYPLRQVELRLYVGRFAAPTRGTHEAAIREWAAHQRVGAGRIKVYGLTEVVGAVRDAAERKQYRDDPVLVTLKVLQAVGELKPRGSH